MTVAPGTRLGVYEITALLGEGGMGQVYRATDTKLKRQVAIKILPPALAADADRLARFQREAEVLASLNHPNIAGIYGLEESGGSTALVMELVEGEDLSQRIARGAIPVDEALPIAKQIAEALEAAHEQGIIHRDLKPANIKVRADGTAKVLDFGLAKALEPAATSSPNMSMSPTITSPAMTKAGVIVGTAAYMSPEQARGKVVDRRTDIWAFGCVLFEMLTGQRAFGGDDVTDTLAAIVRAEPDWKLLPATLSPTVSVFLRRCLQKDSKQRLGDIHDLRLALDGAFDLPLPHAAPQKSLARVAVFAAIAFVAFASALLFRPQPQPQRPENVVQFKISVADGISFEDPPSFAVSPNGRYILVRGLEGSAAYWYLKTFATGEVRRLENTRGTSSSAYWSPDSQWVAFRRQSNLMRLSIADQRIEVLSTSAPAVGAAPGTWLPSGEVAWSASGRFFVLGAPGGTAKLSFETERGRAFNAPSALPRPHAVLLGDTAADGGAILVADLDTSGTLRTIGRGAQPSYVAPGWLLAVRGDQLLAWRFDAEHPTDLGEPQVVHEGLGLHGGVANRLYSASQTGVLAFRNDSGYDKTRLTWYRRDGTPENALKLTAHCRNPELSPNRERVAVECYEGDSINRDIWLYDLARDAATRLTVTPSDDADPTWSPDGQTIAFSSNRRGPTDIFRKSATGVSEEQLAIATPGATPIMAWSPDGRTIVVTSYSDLIAYDVNGDGTPHAIVSGPFQNIELQFSPDGHFVSYSSDETGTAEIYVQPWPQTGDRWQVSNGGGTDARWRPDGRELFYMSPARELMAVPVETAKAFHAGSPVRLFQTRVAGPMGVGHRFPYAVSSDGERFLMYVYDTQAPPPTISVVMNWPGLLNSSTDKPAPK